MISKSEPTEPILTDDGSFTCRHPVFGEPYHALQGARSEADAKFIRPSQLAERLHSGPVRLLDVGFGLGVNCRAALEAARRVPGAALSIDTLESDPLAWQHAAALYPDCPLTRALIQSGTCRDGAVAVVRHDGDLRKTLPRLAGPYDLIFHDPFSPLKNTECWTRDLFQLLAARLHPRGLFLTYSESAAVRAGLLQAGLHIGASPAVPPHRGGTLAAHHPADVANPIDPSPYRVFPKNIPFRDPSLTGTGREIRARREADVRKGPGPHPQNAPEAS